MTLRVGVVGGGLSGLSAAWELRRRGCDVMLFEKGTRVGGRIRSETKDGALFEWGPVAVGSQREAFLELCRELGLEDQVIGSEEESRIRHLYYRGALHPLPTGLRSFLASKLFTKVQKLRVLCEPLMRSGPAEEERCVAEFFGRRVGRGITMTWVDVLVSGACAGNPNRLGINSAFPELFEMEQRYGSIFRGMWHRLRTQRQRVRNGVEVPRKLTLRGGLQDLPRKLGEMMDGSLHLGAEVRSLTRVSGGGFTLEVQGESGGEVFECDRVLIAIPPAPAGILISPLAPDVADLLFEIELAPLVVVNAVFDRGSLPGLPKGAGFLIPRSQRMRTLGWHAISQSFPHMAAEGKVTLQAYLGGSLDRRAIRLDDQLLRHVLLGELALALRQRKVPVPELWEVSRSEGAIPQYNVGHRRRVAAVRHLLGDHAPKLALAGDWVDGFNTDHCIAAGRKAARLLIEDADRP